MFPLWIHWQFADFQSKVTSCRAGCTCSGVWHPFNAPLQATRFSFAFKGNRHEKKNKIKSCLYVRKTQKSWIFPFYPVQQLSWDIISGNSFTSFSPLLFPPLSFLLEQKYLGEGALCSQTWTESFSSGCSTPSCSWKTNNSNYMEAGCMWMQHYFVQPNQLNSITGISLNYRRIHVCHWDSRNQS